MFNYGRRKYLLQKIMSIRKDEQLLLKSEILFSGGMAGFITRMLVQPLDVLKIRMQLEGKHRGRLRAKYATIRRTVHMILKEEGFNAFWKGHVPAQYLSISYGIVEFYTFEMARIHSKQASPPPYQELTDFVCGSLAGVLATVATYPLDMMRTRLVAQTEHQKIYVGLMDGITKVVEREGVSSLYQGLTPSVLSVIPAAGLQFMFYHIFMSLYKYCVKVERNSYNILGNFCSGSLAGVASKTIVYPFDLLRKRLQVQGFSSCTEYYNAGPICSNMTGCIRIILKHEGPLGLFRGLKPTLVKAFFASSLNFTIFETICKVIYRHKLRSKANK